VTFSNVLLGEIVEDITVGHVGPMASEYVPQGVPFLRSLNVEPYKIATADLKFIDASFHTRLRKSALKPGDVVIVRTGKPGTCAVVPSWLEEANCSDLVIVRCGPKILPDYLAYWVNSSAHHHIGSNLVGAVQQHFNVGAARQMPVFLPSVGEQERILSILSPLDKKNELNRRSNETLEAMAQAIFHDWFVDFGPTRRKEAGATDPIEIMGSLTPDPGYATKLAALFPGSLRDGGMPDGWYRESIGNVAHVIDCLHAKKPSRTSAGGVFLQLSNIVDLGMIDMQDTYFISENDYAKWTSRMEASGGDCVITNVGRVGAVAQIPRGLRAALGRNMTGIRCKPDFPNPGFLITCLLSPTMKLEIANRTDSGTILDALNVKSIPKLEFNFGSKDLVSAFERIVGPLREKIEANALESHSLAETRDYLLPRLMSGSVQVKNAALREAV